MKRNRRRVLSGLAAAMSMGLTTMLAGCGNFFVCEKASCPVAPTPGNTGDYAYVSNSTAGQTFINGYVLSAGTLAPMTTPTFNLGFVPTALAVSKQDTFLYAASGSSGVFVYAIGTGGVLTVPSNSTPVANGFVDAMDISPDGNNLFTVDSTGTNLTQYSINISTGVLTLVSTFQLPLNGVVGNTCTVALPCGVKVSPSGLYVAVALGQSGDAIYQLNGSIVNPSPIPIPLPTGVGDFAVTMDSTDHAYFARTAGVAVFSLVGGTATSVAGSPFAAAAGPRSIVLDSSGKYVYDANFSGATLSSFTTVSGVLTPFSPATVAAPTNVSSLAVDNSGKYLVAVGYNTTGGLQLYSVGSTGVLTSLATAGTGATLGVPAVIAVTH
ncbi:MAG: beta-propeller fold lactonase family protein [Acidobacteriaceae bacterium]